MKNKRNNEGFTLVEFIITIAIMAIIAGVLVPALIQYVKKTRRSVDIDSANKIAEAVERAIIDYNAGTTAGSYHYTTAIMWNKDSTPTNPPQNVFDYAWDEIGKMPPCKTNKDYFWIVYYDSSTGQVSKVCLTPHPGGREYELYPDSDKFYKKGLQ